MSSVPSQRLETAAPNSWRDWATLQFAIPHGPAHGPSSRPSKRTKVGTSKNAQMLQCAPKNTHMQHREGACQTNLPGPAHPPAICHLPRVVPAQNCPDQPERRATQEVRDLGVPAVLKLSGCSEPRRPQRLASGVVYEMHRLRRTACETANASGRMVWQLQQELGTVSVATALRNSRRTAPSSFADQASSRILL